MFPYHICMNNPPSKIERTMRFAFLAKLNTLLTFLCLFNGFNDVISTPEINNPQQ